MAASDQSAEIHVGYIANLVNIEYPGCIKNPEKALQTLGGLKKLKEVGRNIQFLSIMYWPYY